MKVEYFESNNTQSRWFFHIYKSEGDRNTASTVKIKNEMETVE